MTGRDVAASVRARLLSFARAERTEFQRVLVRFANERLLVRLARSPHAWDFVLKGATLFTLWTGRPHRATKDLDLLGRGTADIERLVAVFREVVAVPCPEDGLRFDGGSISGEAIREEARYFGVRVVIPTELAGARLVLQVDVGLGDATVPPPEEVDLPVLLGLPGARLRAYRRETVVAEKLEALVVLGLPNSRMKDYYDLDLLRRTFAFDRRLVEAIAATFARRGTGIPDEVPVGLTDAFAADAGKAAQWGAFVRRADVADAGELPAVVAALRAWLWPVMVEARRRGA